MAFTLDHNILRNATATDLARYLRNDALKYLDALTISSRILAAVEAEALPPRVFAIWTTACPDDIAIVTGLKQLHSIGSRLAAIKAFGRRFRTTRCASLWQALGGTGGIVEAMAEWSVDEVKAFCRAVGRCSTKMAEKTTRQKLVTELLRALLSEQFSESMFENPDRRPLITEYSSLAYACTPEFVAIWRKDTRLLRLDSEKVIMADPKLYSLQFMSAIERNDQEISEYLPLVYSAMSGRSKAEPSVSESTEFAIQVLEAMLIHKCRSLNVYQAKDILISIIHRVSRSKTTDAFAARALGAVVKCHRSWPFPRKDFELDKAGIVAHIASLWRRDPDTFESDATYILRQVPSHKCPSIYNVDGIICSDDKSRRCRLLKWLVANMKSLQIDLDSSPALKRWRGDFPAKILHALPKAEGLILLDKLESVGHEFSSEWISPFDDGSVSFVRLSLLSSLDEVRHLANVEVMKCRKQAETSRDQPKRASWAGLAFKFAIASRDLNIYSATLLWARRYNRDPLTAMSLYVHSVVGTREAVGLVSGIPTELPANITLESVADQVHKGNAILMLLLETACICQTEPSFQARHWSAVLGLFRSVVKVRCDRVNPLQKRLGASDEDIYKAVWADTVEMLLNAEEVGLDEKNSLLQFHTTGGVLTGQSYGTMQTLTVKNASKATLKFANELMSQRDALWQRYRPTIHSATAALTKPWPRGLPIQALEHFEFNPKPPQGSLPLLESRARSVVFMNPNDALSALPGDEDMRAAIGLFVDSYVVALRLYARTKAESTSRNYCTTLVHHDDAASPVLRTEAWHYATRSLAHPSMAPVEARLYWNSVFQSAGQDLPPEILDLLKRPDPELPFSEDIDELVEWNPDVGCPPEVAHKSFEPTCIDMFTKSRTAVFDVHARYVEATSEVQRYSLPLFWALGRYMGQIAPRAREAYIAAAVLLTDSEAAAGSKVLQTSFPSRHEIRFPALFLDDAFLERRNIQNLGALSVLERLLIDVPPTLLRSMADATLEKWEAEPRSVKPRSAVFFALVKLLAWGDKPKLALDLITKVLVDMPNESSWHRELLHQGILKRLPSYLAQTLVTALGDKIFEKLEKQAQKAAEPKPEIEEFVPGTSSADHVKISTVKMLAQMIQGAKFVDEQSSLDVLLSLLTRSKHIDVRVAIVDSLVTILKSTSSGGYRERIFVALEQHVLPIAASINERVIMTEEHWQISERELTIPGAGIEDTHSPIATLLEVAALTTYPSLKAEMMPRLIFPMLEQSTANNKRWTRIFLRKHQVTELFDQLPAMPFHHTRLSGLASQGTEFITPEQFELLSQAILTTYDPPLALQQLNQSFHEAPKEVRGANDVQHWLSQWGPQGTAALQPSSLIIARLLCNTNWNAVSSGLMPTDLMNHERSVIDLMIEDYDNRSSDWATYTERYSPRYFDHLRSAAWAAWDNSSAWTMYCKPMIEYMIERINATRTPEWQSNPKREPPYLPDTFSLRLWLLNYPSGSADSSCTSISVQCRTFANELIALIEELAASGKPYQNRFEQLTQAAKQGAQSGAGFVQLAVALGEMNPKREWNLAELLRIELAETLIAGSSKPDAAVALKRMLIGWARSGDEEVRRRGLEKLKDLRKIAEREGEKWEAFL